MFTRPLPFVLALHRALERAQAAPPELAPSDRRDDPECVRETWLRVRAQVAARVADATKGPRR